MIVVREIAKSSVVDKLKHSVVIIDKLIVEIANGKELSVSQALMDEFTFLTDKKNCLNLKSRVN